VIFKLFAGLITHWQGGAERLIEPHSFGFYIQRLFHVIFWIDWGLVFTAPFVLMGMGTLFLVRREIRWRLAVLIIPFLINVYVTLQWGTQGGWYGYRYLLFPAITTFIFPFACCLDRFFDGKARWPRWPLVLLAVAPVFSMVLFEGNDQGLTLKLVPQYFGQTGWGNNDYQLQVWSHVFMHPLKAIGIFLGGGIAYGAHVVSVLFHVQDWIPLVLLKYPVFEWETFVRVLIIYAMPFVFYAVYRKYVKEPA
jgi:hypothetical protein